MSAETERTTPRRPRTVFWKVAGVLILAQVATALLAVFLIGYFARERALELVRGNLILRLDQTAEEVESRADYEPDTGTLQFSRRLAPGDRLRIETPGGGGWGPDH